MAKKKSAASKAPLPFLTPRREGRTHVERPLNWSADRPSTWLFPIRLFASDVDDLRLRACAVRQLRSEDLIAMREVEFRPAISLFGNQMPIALSGVWGRRWDDFDGREFPWVLDVPLPPDAFDKAETYAGYLRRTTEVALRLMGGRYVWLSEPVVYQPGVENSLLGEYALARDEFPGCPGLGEIPPALVTL
jgi:hypothetical protein